jgi:hypothetical protein
MPQFSAWTHETLAKFAQEAYVKLQEQETRIEQLEDDLKVAINAYRELLK